MGERRVPAALGIGDDLVLELRQLAEYVESRLDGRDDLLGLDALGGSDQTLDVDPVVVTAA
jgi:hypothetical protein